MATQSATIALAGNPNVGKSTLFNALTGARQHVGNWPGKTVEKKEGRFNVDGRDIAMVDLPGTYSLSAYSVEETIARDFLIDAQPNAVVAVADASNLERNLYLVTQLLELELPLILVLNMADTARNRQVYINVDLLSAQLGGIPVIEMVGNRGIGMDELRQAIGRLTDRQVVVSSVRLAYDETLETEIAALVEYIEATPALAERYNARWLAVKLLEADESLRRLARRRALPAHRVVPGHPVPAARHRPRLGPGEVDVEHHLRDRDHFVAPILLRSAPRGAGRPCRGPRAFTGRRIAFSALTSVTARCIDPRSSGS